MGRKDWIKITHVIMEKCIAMNMNEKRNIILINKNIMFKVEI